MKPKVWRASNEGIGSISKGICSEVVAASQALHGKSLGKCSFEF